ncbi:glucose-1-phosphate thymidylyltransferase [Vibrio nigripulchritudo SOn1]|uniref:Glucose-1-phosphate thymidylyltransferase n=1 Tax=Vibrio nigripulchritudo SOn1 TaxID=1238450 RepID=A0AAV2VUC1_9VIBR|nr:glucose-1-phosphate thymidylyltransferase RfbA [Vibrio nigripulchritudo]CCO48210.1 glucose-1-phosphate thymidylyltransferase [Vibrio nigripulchritudo SOn1]
MKGIILAGGTGTRLFPLTKGISKHLLAVYDKPMIYYPISTLMLAGIQEILIITAPEDLNNFKRLLGDGENFGIKIEYACQQKPNGIVEAFIIAEEYINGDSVCLILGDNIFYGQSFTNILLNAQKLSTGATILGYQVKDPERFGVVEFNEDLKILSIEEKPVRPKSNYAIPGLYFYDNQAVSFAKTIKPSSSGELEITSLNQIYLENDSLQLQLLGRGFAWLDTGTQESLHEASSFVQAIENVQGLKIACLEEIAWRKGWLTRERILEIAKPMLNCEYGHYLNYIVGNQSLE